MTVLSWLRLPEKRAQLCGRLLLGVATIWALFRLARSLRILFDASHDLNIYYSLWFLLCHRDYADIALSQALYLPHTWLVLTPFFVLGWPAARLLMLLLNVACVFYIWWRLSRLAGLQGLRRWLLLAFFWSWLSTGLVIGLGNLALICVAAALAAFPFTSATNSAFLTLSAMKQSLVFPIYFQLLFKRPKALVLPFVVMAVCGAAMLFWTRLGPADLARMAGGSLDTVQAWTEYDLVSLRRLFRPCLGDGAALSAVVWAVWFALYGVVMWRIKEPLTQLAALLLLGLLPIYHHEYDLVAAAPALALFLRRGSLAWPTLMTLLLAVNLVFVPRYILPAGLLRTAAEAVASVYNPLLVLACLGGLVWLEAWKPHLPQGSAGSG
ncbi:MAG TPA: hypothetical protein P5205_12190 [Candidatus Paceibacterota bacterium]|nr:hypothetical protein [Verrucomicrobiota bacterium]HSA11120.1 hypothetical protein [Candidatus Paceibacterota bacterium]